MHFLAGELVCAPFCSGSALLQRFAGCELQASEELAATFCFLVYLFSCIPLPNHNLHLYPPITFIAVAEKHWYNFCAPKKIVLEVSSTFSLFALPAQLLFLSSQTTSESQCLFCSQAQGSHRE